MKRLLVVPATVLALFLLNSFVQKEKEAGGKTFAKASAAKLKGNKPGLSNIVFKSADGGKTWQDISQDLPETEQPVNFFAGGSDLYLQVKNVM